MKSLTLSISALALAAGAACGDEARLRDLPAEVTPLPIPHHRVWHITQNLGPTGARGWILGSAGHTRDSREILIKTVEPGSPGDGVLQPYDLILGAAVPPDEPAHRWTKAPALRPFESDARMSLARAITWAEGRQGGGRLPLLVQRDGVVDEVTVEIPVLGDYAEGPPMGCPKSRRIVAGAAGYLAERMPVDGFAPGVSEAYNGMLMLAADDPALMDHVRRTACRMSVRHEVATGGHETWRWGSVNLFLCEYYLATGDARVLPTIQEYCNRLAAGQCNPGTWGHRIVPDFIPPGYGSVNSTGVVCFLSMAMAEFTSVSVNETALANSIRFFGGYAGRGSIPYGDHVPGDGPTSNGKNGVAAVAFNLLGAEGASQWFAKMNCSSNLRTFENGHSGNFFNQTWTPLGASLAGAEHYAAFWQRFHSYRDLARRWDGSFITQPWPHGREGDLGTINYVRRGPLWSTGGFALSYLAGSEALAILGRRQSVFSPYAPPEFGPALERYREHDHAACIELAEPLAGSTDESVRKMAAQLIRMAGLNQQSLELSLADMKKSLATGDLFKLQAQLEGIESILDPADPRLEKFRAALAAPGAEEIIEDGAAFDRELRNISFHGPRGYERVTTPGEPIHWKVENTVRRLSAKDGSPYQERAQELAESWKKRPVKAEVSLLKPEDKDESPVPWRISPEGGRVPKGWEQPAFRDGGWESVDLPVDRIRGTRMLRASFGLESVDPIESLLLEQGTGGIMRVYLNGTMILDVQPRDGRSKYDKRSIPLKPSTRKLLREGRNVLAVEVQNPEQGLKFDIDLKAGFRK